jgi:uncharacterized protein YicC (UPF0701 family)
MTLKELERVLERELEDFHSSLRCGYHVRLSHEVTQTVARIDVDYQVQDLSRHIAQLRRLARQMTVETHSKLGKYLRGDT